MKSLRLALKRMLWPGFNWVSRDKAKLVNLLLRDDDENKIKTLDIGCGNGFFTTQAAQRGNSCVGITIHEWEKEKCEEMRDALSISPERLEFRVSRLSSFSQETVFRHSFDQILMIDMLEHVLDDIGALKQAHDLLSKDGLLFVSVPNRDFEFDKKASHVTRFENGWHVRHGYTFEQLERLLESAGFEPIDRRRYGTLGTAVVGWIQVNILRMNDLVMIAFFPVLVMIDWLFRPWKKTHTVLVIARKQSEAQRIDVDR